MVQSVKNLPAMQETPCNAGDPDLIPESGKIPWRREWQPTPVFLPGESHEQRSLGGYSPQNHKKSDVNEATEHACTHIYVHEK